MKVNIGVSNRHVHLCEKDLKLLFGESFKLEIAKPLTQADDFASTSKVTLKTDKDIIENVRVVGPLRNYTQVEVSKTDAFKLGINPPVRDSGDLKGSSGITIIGPNGKLNLNEGCIIAARHIHITPDQRKEFGLTDVEEVSVRIDGSKGGVLNHVRLKEGKNYSFELHLDTDDANAHLIKQGDIATILMDETTIKKI